jgi:FHS family L-fucose permease-like MFS transporter
MFLGLVAFAWAVLIAFTKFPTLRSETGSAEENHGRIKDLVRYPHFIHAVVAQFLYVGAQVGTWSYFIQYVQDTPIARKKSPDISSPALWSHSALAGSPVPT